MREQVRELTFLRMSDGASGVRPRYRDAEDERAWLEDHPHRGTRRMSRDGGGRQGFALWPARNAGH